MPPRHLAPRSAATGRPYEPVDVFPQGIASGDPTADAVVLWTAVDPALDDGTGVDVHCVVATDPELAEVVTTAVLRATAAHAHTVHHDVTGLAPDGVWYYAFEAAGVRSPVGRTRTAPAPDTERDVTFAWFSCQQWADGWFTAHHSLAESWATGRDLDFVLNLGDYIYDTTRSRPEPRRHDPVGLARTLDAYRAKYRLYRSDPRLQAVHANYPMYSVFDDAEVGDPKEWAGTFPDEEPRDGGMRAWFEHMPVRADESARAWPPDIRRRVAWGRRLELFLTDQRCRRDPVVPGGFSFTAPEMAAPDRSMLGDDQFRWLCDGLSGSLSQWKVYGSQLMFAPLRGFAMDNPLLRRLGLSAGDNAGFYVNAIQWDGYQAERRRILDRLAADGVRDTVIVSGDIHTWWVSELRTDVDDPSTPRVATEFVGTSITSANAKETFRGMPSAALMRLLERTNPSLVWAEGDTHGWGLAHFGADAAEVTFVAVDSVADDRAVDARALARFRVPSGTQSVSVLSDGR